jgi:hypothetical protein
MLAGIMLPPRLCSVCEKRLHDASYAMRRHGTLMSTAIHLARTISATDEQRQEFRIRVVLSFNDAQLAWDAYREHLIEHGFLPSPE